MLLGRVGDLLHLALAEQRRWPRRAYAEPPGAHDVNADCLRQATGFLHASFARPPRRLSRQLRHGDDRPFSARDLDRAIAVERVQDSPSEGASGSVPRFSAWAGCRVESACL